MNKESCIEINILKNLKTELTLFKTKSPDSLIMELFRSKEIPNPLKSKRAFKHGLLFIGKKENPKYTGFGMIVYPTPEPFTKCYIGEFKKGKRHGEGFRLLNNTLYKGSYKRDLKHGPAVIWELGKFGSQVVFRGEYDLGKMHGKCFVQDEEHKFDGYVIKGKYHGPCTIIYSNGDTYKGTMINGNISGRGKIIYKNGDIYEGGFLNNMRTGEGNYKWFLSNMTVNLSSDISGNRTEVFQRSDRRVAKILTAEKISQK